MTQPNTVTVHIMDKEYCIACPPEERSNLEGAARYLDRKMRDIRSSGVDLDEPERPGLVDLRYRAGHDVEPLVGEHEHVGSLRRAPRRSATAPG